MIKMADGRTHSKWFFIFLILIFIPLLIYIKLWFFIPILFLSNAIIDPDEDQKWLKGRTHRNFITHSIIWSLLIAVAFSTSLYGYVERKFVIDHLLKLFAVFCLPILLHLILDLRSKSGKRYGKYCVYFYKGKRLNGGWTICWMLVNIIAIILYIIKIFFFMVI